MSDFIQFNPVQVSDNIPENTSDLASICNELAAMDLLVTYSGTSVTGSNGNVSKRNGTGVTITATQLPSKENLEPADFVTIEKCTQLDAYYHGSKLPSSECLMHWHLYESFPETKAIIHIHESNELLYSDLSQKRWDELKIAETEQNAQGSTIEVGITAAETFTKGFLYVVLKDHRPEWDLQRTGAVIMGKSLEEAHKRTATIHKALKK